MGESGKGKAYCIVTYDRGMSKRKKRKKGYKKRIRKEKKDLNKKRKEKNIWQTLGESLKICQEKKKKEKIWGGCIKKELEKICEKGWLYIRSIFNE